MHVSTRHGVTQATGGSVEEATNHDGSRDREGGAVIIMPYSVIIFHYVWLCTAIADHPSLTNVHF